MSQRALHSFGGAIFLCSLASVAVGPLAENVPVWLLIYCLPTLLLAGALFGRPASNPTVLTVLLWAILIRLPFLWTTPSLSDDIYRYVWEGRVVAEGLDPYDLPPDSPKLEHLAVGAPERPLVNHPDLPALYPAGAQWVFAVLSSLGFEEQLFRVFFLLCDLALCLVLLAILRARGSPSGWSLLYAWHPLAAVEVASSGHFDPLAMLPLLAGFYLWETGRLRRAFLLWGLAAALKFVGGFASLFGLAVLWRTRELRDVAIGATLTVLPLLLLSLPFAVDGSAPLGSAKVYGAHWMNFGSVHALLSIPLGVHPARVLCVGLGGLWLGWLLWRTDSPVRGFSLLFLGMLLLSPVVHPWYGLWLLVLLPLWPRLELFALVSLLPLAYVAWVSSAKGGDWLAPSWAAWLSYGVPMVLFVWTNRARKRAG